MKCLPLAAIFAVILPPATVYAYGEGDSIPYESRAIHLLTNEVRTDVHKAIDICGTPCHEGKSCYGESLDAVYWDNNLFRAAQFHAAMSSKINASAFGCMQHPSACELVDNIAEIYPETCDASPSCACKTGQATCGQQGTSTSARVNAFGTRFSGENLVAATNATPYQLFYLLFHENSTDDPSGCGFTVNNGHRVNILTNHNALGVGFAGMMAVQDFGRIDTVSQPISSGSHYIDTNRALWFKLHYDAQTDAKTAYLALGQSCLALSRSLGNDKRGIWSVSGDQKTTSCTPYYYEVQDANGTISRYPTTGALLYNCDKSWTNGTSNAVDHCIQSDTSGNNGNGNENPDNGNPDNGNENPDNGNGNENPDNGNENPDNGNGNENPDNGNENSNNGNTDSNNGTDSLENGCSATPYRRSSHAAWLLWALIPFGYAINRYRRMTHLS